MTHFHFKRLEKFRAGGSKDKPVLRIPLPQTPSGKIYRYCPNTDCKPRLFLLGDAKRPEILNKSKVKREPGSPFTTCPYCVTSESDDDFNYEGDIQSILQYIKWAVAKDVGNHLKRMTKEFNSSQRRGGLFSLKMEIKPDRTPEPRAWREDLIRNLACNICGRNYGVYAIALFCPDCGGKNIGVHFEREIELVLEQIDLAEQISESGNYELSYRILGNAHEDVVTAFETYQKIFYKHKIIKSFKKEEADELIKKKSIGTSFQNLQKAKKLYKNLSIDPFLNLTQSNLNSIRLNLEKRHIIGHNLSMIDEAYSETSGIDTPGTTVKILAEEISKFSMTSQKLILELENLL